MCWNVAYGTDRVPRTLLWSGVEGPRAVKLARRYLKLMKTDSFIQRVGRL